MIKIIQWNLRVRLSDYDIHVCQYAKIFENSKSSDEDKKNGSCFYKAVIQDYISLAEFTKYTKKS